MASQAGWGQQLNVSACGLDPGPNWDQHPACHTSVYLGVFWKGGGYHRHPVYVFYVDGIICVQQGEKKNTIPEPGMDSLPTFPAGHRKSELPWQVTFNTY